MTRIQVLNGPIASFSHAQIVPALLDTGVLILRGPDTTLEDFLGLSQSLSSAFVRHGLGPGDYRMVGASWSRRLIKGMDSLFTAAGQQQHQELGLHGEFYFHVKDPAHLLWFYCKQASEASAPTLVCDGMKLFASLTPADQAVFLGRKLVYERVQSRKKWQEQYQLESETKLAAYLREQHHDFELQPDGTLFTRFTTPALRYRQGRPAFVNNFIPFARQQLNAPDRPGGRISFADGHPITRELVERVAALAESLTRPIFWQPGDIGLIDNTRMLHGRKQKQADDPREIYMRMSWSDFLARLQEPVAVGR
ncbi:MAG TPA: TauD/TfdA family dioxygenase [Candidatus Obscuribacterales bacterium]